MHDEYHKRIRRRIEEYLRKADEDTIIGLAMIFKIDLSPKGFKQKIESTNECEQQT